MAGQSILPRNDYRRYESPEARPQSPLLAIALGPTQIVRSSLSSSWSGILLERHLYAPGERKSASIDKHVVSMSHGCSCRLEHRKLSGEFVAASIRPRAIMITPAGLLPDTRLHTSVELTHCALEDQFIRGVADELDHPVKYPMFRPAIEDKSIQRSWVCSQTNLRQSSR